MIEKRDLNIEWDANKPWDEDLNKILEMLMSMLDTQETVSSEELWLKFNKTSDYRNGYFVYLIETFFTQLETIKIEENKPAEFIFRKVVK